MTQQYHILYNWFPAELRPNARVDKYKKNSIFQQYKAHGRNGAIDVIGFEKKPIAITMLFSPPDNRRRDLDNCLAASKALLDGIAQGIGIDDRYFYPITIDWGDGEKGSIEVTLCQ